jgi:CMP-N-acetylneuraminic acid synthetase
MNNKYSNEFIKMQKVAGLITESQLEEAFDFFKKEKI